jgi:hypothetical protein
MDEPKMVPVSEATFLRDDDDVLAVTIDGESRAYPMRFIGWHHGINDRIGKTPYAVTYCSVCRTGIGYDLRMEGKERPLDFYGLYNGVVVLCDRETKSVFLQADGRYVKGPLLGKRLKTIPVLDVTWGKWKELHPDTKVMSPDTPFNQYYRPAGGAGGAGAGNPMRNRQRLSPFFVETVARGDLRLSPFEKVLGVALTANGEVTDATRHRAYPLKGIVEAGGVANDEAEGLQIAVFVDPTAQTAAAVSRKLDGRTLTFESRKNEQGQPVIFDRETSSSWTIEGTATGGPLKGKKLPRLAGNISLWYGWGAYFPQSSIYGRTDAPQPGDPFANERAPAEPKQEK